jgi:hypothetical protein
MTAAMIAMKNGSLDMGVPQGKVQSAASMGRQLVFNIQDLRKGYCDFYHILAHILRIKLIP